MRYIWDSEARAFVSPGEYHAKAMAGVKRSKRYAVPTMILDMAPYRSPVTGEMVSSRSRHRDILHRHGLEELGNDKVNLGRRQPVPLPSAKKAVKEAIGRVRSGYRPKPAEKIDLNTAHIY